MGELMRSFQYILPVYVGAVILTLLFERITHFKRCQVVFASARRESMLGIFLFVFSIGIGVSIKVAFHTFLATLFEEYKMPTFTLLHLAVGILILSATFIPFAVTLLIKRQSLMTIGLSRQNLFSSIFLGVLLSSVNVLSYVIVFNKLNVVGGLQLYHLYYFIYTLCMGFTEEAIFRGYLHLRFTAWLGASRGLVLTALMFAISHIGSTIPNVISTFIFGLITGWILYYA